MLFGNQPWEKCRRVAVTADRNPWSRSAGEERCLGRTCMAGPYRSLVGLAVAPHSSNRLPGDHRASSLAPLLIWVHPIEVL